MNALFAAIAVYTVSVYGSMAMMSLGAGLFTVGWLAQRRAKALIDLRTAITSPLLAPSLALAAACIASLAWAHFSGADFLGMRPEIHWLEDTRKLWHLGFPFLLAAALSSAVENTLKRLTKLWLALALAAGTLGIVQHFVPIYKPMELPDGGLRGLYHATGLAGFHLSYASIMSFPTMAWLVILGWRARREGFSRLTVGISAGCAMLLVANHFTYSKIAWAAVPFAALVSAPLLLKGRKGILTMAAVLALTAAVFSSKTVRERFVGVRTINDRLILWEANMAMIKVRPLLGVGWHHNSELTEAYYRTHGVRSHFEHVDVTAFHSHAHNTIIDQWSSTGTLGLAALLWWLGTAFLMSWRLFKDGIKPFYRLLGLAFFAGWICFHINGLTQTNFWDAKVMHQMGWVTALLMELHRRGLPRRGPV